MEIKDTILLPKTDFSMKADLPKKEPSILEKWQTEEIYKKLRETSLNKEKFIFMTDPLTQMVIFTWAMPLTKF
jgi:isoleucyl-tRNA synthetase